MLGSLRRRLPVWPLVLGCLLPDVIDKPLFYGLIFFHGFAPSPFLGSRTVGHTLLFVVVLSLSSAIFRRDWLWAVTAGVATHLLLDVAGEPFAGHRPESSVWRAVFWPLLGWNFPLATYATPLEHLWVGLSQVYVLCGEAIGGAILLRAWWRRRQPS